MNTAVQPDQFSHWREAIHAGKPVDTERGNPRSGYYRVKNEAVAFWREPDGELACWRSGTFPTPTDPDAIDELFGWCAPHPVAYEAFEFFRENERWPEQLEPIAAPAADLPPHEAVDAELTAVREQAKAWIAEIGAVKTAADADKSANYADAFAKIEKRASEQHKAEKAPHLEAGRAVDTAWKPIIERAAECKGWAKKAAEAFLIAEKKRLAEEERKRVEEAAKLAREAEAARLAAEKAGEPPPPEAAWTPPPPPAKAKAGTSGRVISVRTRTVHEIIDLRALLNYFADMNEAPRDLMDTLQLLVNRMRVAGVTVPGVETKAIEGVA